MNVNSEKPIKVSVIIPVYNTAPYLDECLNSVLSQTLREIEVICVNDGSTDNSLDILNKYAQQDNRVKVISQPNMGLSAARNRGLQCAKGDYIYMLDSDDYIEKEAFNFLVKEMERQDLDVLFFDAKVFYDSEELEKDFPDAKNFHLRRSSLDQVYSGQQILSKLKKRGEYRVEVWMQLISSRHIKQNGLSFCEEIRYAEDNLFTFQNLLAAKRVSHRNILFYHRRVRSDSIVRGEKDSRYFLGIFYAYIKMMSSFLLTDTDPTCEQELFEVMEDVKKRMVSIYKQLCEKSISVDFSSLNNMERQILAQLVFGQLKPLPKSEKSIEVLAAIYKEEASMYKEEVSAIRSSWSYRAGRFITLIPRKIRELLR